MCGFKIRQRLSLFRISLGKNIRGELDGIDDIKKYCSTQTNENMKIGKNKKIIKNF